MKKGLLMAMLMIGLAGFVISGATISYAQTGKNLAKEKEFRIERSMPKEAVACIECHKTENPPAYLPTGPTAGMLQPTSHASTATGLRSLILM